TILGVLAYDSIGEACDDVPRLLEFQPSAIELIPELIIRLARSVPAYARQMGWMTGSPAAVLVVEFSGDQPSALKERVRKIGEVIAIAETSEEQSRVWNIRKMGLGILDSRPQSARPAAFIEDCAIPVERLGHFTREVERILREHNVEGGFYAHASAGCLHIRPILDLHRGEGVRFLRSIGDAVLQLTLSLGGSMSSEHGDGIVAGEWIEKTYGAEIAEAMRSLKRAADPDNILNPKKMLDAPPMDTHLRYGETYRVNAWNSSLHFDHERGLAGAVEHCNGQGVCRKFNGVMCPSFQATRDEQNSTRGRANLLRALITNYESRTTYSVINDNQLTDSTHRALDLCLACKGCTSECPSGVDMPKLKYEFMNEYYKTHRRHARDYLFGYFHIVSKWLAPIAPIANLFMQMDWSRKLAAQMMGITKKRPFPLYVRGGKVKRHAWKSGLTKKVIFLSDVFARYLEPEVEDAALEILHAAGYEVKVLPIIGAGASLLSKGFIDAARRHAEKVLGEIRAIDIESSLSVVGCEPPEIYCLKHEYVSLLPNRREEIESISKRVWLLDEFLLRDDFLKSKHGLDTLREKHAELLDHPIIFHPHCHQRAEALSVDGLPTGTAATVELLRAFGFTVNVTDAGCCGMAGTFGYDAEHYDLSIQIGELKLFPYLREIREERLGITSSGSACRLQIKQGTGTQAAHPLVFIANILNDESIRARL
ncbi:MAG: 4Fe-4S dicluster domain-containing protein, partial [Chloroflexi bacterium]|nr:4Fe-4S dicluster domain-containing protein [Chloroflexota bacterium]